MYLLLIHKTFLIHPQRIRQLVTDPKVREVDAAVLVMLYALRHEGHPNTDFKGLVSALNKRSVGDRYLKARQWLSSPHWNE